MRDSKEEAFEFFEMVRRSRMTQEDRDQEDQWRADLLKSFIPQKDTDPCKYTTTYGLRLTLKDPKSG